MEGLQVLRGGGDDGGNEVPDLVHGMIVFLVRLVLGGIFLPAVLVEFPQGIMAAGGKAQLFQAQQLADPANAVENIVLSREDGVDAVTTDTLHKAGS